MFKWIIAFILIIAGCERLVTNNVEVTKEVPVKKLQDFPWAEQEVMEHIALCGVGVVEGQEGPNKCSYHIKVDDLMYQHPSLKTGLLHDPEFAFKGASFYEPDDMKEEDIPDSFDLRDLMKNGVPDIRQQNCGDCWAWATHHGLEIVRAVHDQKNFDHSVQTVLSCSKHGSCNGGYMSAPDFLLNRGLPYEPDFSYQGKDARCKFSSDELAKGWEGKVISAPYIGKSSWHSRGAPEREGTKVKAMMEAMLKLKSPLVVTVAAYSSSGGVVDSCSAINSGGNHMVAIVGWEMWKGKRVAHVWNSWGKSHGENGVSKIVWECGDGRLNRGLGVDARVYEYKGVNPPDPCELPENVIEKPKHMMFLGSSVKLGRAPKKAQTCKWIPADGIDNPNSCETYASPNRSTEYHLEASNACGKVSGISQVDVYGPMGKLDDSVLTPFGIINRNKKENK